MILYSKFLGIMPISNPGALNRILAASLKRSMPWMNLFFEDYNTRFTQEMR